MKYDWGNYKFCQDFIEKITTNTVNNIDARYLHMAQEYSEDVEEFILQCIRNRYITAENFQDVIGRMNRLNSINVLPDNLRGIYGVTSKREHVMMNPGLDRNRRRLYLFHELAHMAVSMDENVMQNNWEGYHALRNARKQPINNDINFKYGVHGWVVIEEGIAQEIAESCLYSSLNTKRPAETTHQDGYTLGNIHFPSNFDYYGLYQPLMTAFGRTLRGVGTSPSDSGEVIRKQLCQKAFNNDFVLKIIREYNSDLGLDTLYRLLGKLGVIYNRKLDGFGQGRKDPACSLAKTRECYLGALTQMKQLEDYRPEIETTTQR